MFFEDNIDDAKYCGHLYGLGTSFVANGAGYDTYNNSHTPVPGVDEGGAATVIS